MRLLVVEDEKTLGNSIAQSLRNAGFAVDWMESCKAAIHALGSEHFDLLILDVGLPDGSGFDVVNYVRRQGMLMPILILTARDAIEDRIQGLDLGADDYVIKPITMPELHARVRAQLRRSKNNGSNHLVIGRLELDSQSKRASVDGAPLELSAREWSVLEYLVINAGKIISKEQLIQAISSWDQELSANAIEAYVHRVRTKIQGADISIRTIRGLGYMMEEPHEK